MICRGAAISLGTYGHIARPYRRPAHSTTAFARLAVAFYFTRPLRTTCRATRAQCHAAHVSTRSRPAHASRPPHAPAPASAFCARPRFLKRPLLRGRLAGFGHRGSRAALPSIFYARFQISPLRYYHRPLYALSRFDIDGRGISRGDVSPRFLSRRQSAQHSPSFLWPISLHAFRFLGRELDYFASGARVMADADDWPPMTLWSASREPIASIEFLCHLSTCTFASLSLASDEIDDFPVDAALRCYSPTPLWHTVL